MRRRTLLLAAGLLAYFIGATVRVHLGPEEPCGPGDAGCRARAAAGRPLPATDILVTGDAHYSE